MQVAIDRCLLLNLPLDSMLNDIRSKRYRAAGTMNIRFAPWCTDSEGRSIVRG